MKRKAFRVFVAVFVMAAFCCVPAFAAPSYPSELPPLPDFQEYDEVYGGEDVEYHFAVTEREGIYYLVVSDDDNYFAYLGDGFYSVIDTEFNDCCWGDFSYEDGAWQCNVPMGNHSELYESELLVPGKLIYANCTVYGDIDFYGDNRVILYEDGYYVPVSTSNFFKDLRAVGMGVLSWTGDVAQTIVAQPVLLLTMGILLLGGAIGIFRRLLSRD